MNSILTDDKATVEQLVAMAKQFGATFNVEEVGNGRFRLTMSEEDATKMPKVYD